LAAYFSIVNSEEGLYYQKQLGEHGFEVDAAPLEDVLMINMTRKPIFYYADYFSSVIHSNTSELLDDDRTDSYLPTWQASPVLMKQRANENILRRPSGGSVQRCLTQRSLAFGPLETTGSGYPNSTDSAVAFIATLRSIQERKQWNHSGSPVVTVSIPLFDSLSSNDRRFVGVMSVTTSFRRIYFDDILPDNVVGLVAVVHSTCGDQYTYEINGPHASVMGPSDLHDQNFDGNKRQSTIIDNKVNFPDGSPNGTSLDLTCQYYVEVYPSQVSI
jgi:hypothetical protein